MTAELLEQLLESASPEAYLSHAVLEDRSLSEYLHALLREKGLRRSDVIRGSGLNATFVYQIFYGTRHPRRDTAIMLAFGLHCTLQEAQRILKLAGSSELWCKNRRDAILIFCLEHGLSREQADDELFRLGEETLLSGE